MSQYVVITQKFLSKIFFNLPAVPVVLLFLYLAAGACAGQGAVITEVGLPTGVSPEARLWSLAPQSWGTESFQAVDVVVLREPPGACLWENIERERLDARVSNGTAFISAEQLGQLFRRSFDARGNWGRLTGSGQPDNVAANSIESGRKASVEGKEFDLSERQLRLSGSSSKSWLPLREWATAMGAQVLWLDRPRPLILLNLSGSSVAWRAELDPGWRVSGEARQYGYRDLKPALKAIERLYPGVKLASIGRSALGQDIPAAVLGSGPVEIFISGAWHGDENITAAFLVKFIEDACLNFESPYWTSLLKSATLYFAPMINPDGCEIATHGEDLPPPLAEAAAAIAPPFYERGLWRANGQGIDLNNQFPARWEESLRRLQYNVPPRGSAGNQPLEAPESRAVYEFTLEHNFAAVICYHSQGEVVFWRSLNGQETPAMKRLAETYSRESGYYPVSTTDLSGGYRDWFVTTFNRPGLTVEVGRGENPLPLQQFENIWERNSRALMWSLQELVR